MWLLGVPGRATTSVLLLSLVSPPSDGSSLILLQGSPPAGRCAGPPVTGRAAGGTPPEGLGRPGHRHWGGAAAAR